MNSRTKSYVFSKPTGNVCFFCDPVACPFYPAPDGSRRSQHRVAQRYPDECLQIRYVLWWSARRTKQRGAKRSAVTEVYREFKREKPR